MTGVTAATSAASPPAITASGSTGSSEAAAPARSTSTIRHQLKQAEKALAATQRRHAALAAQLVEVGAAGDHVRMADLGAELAAATAEMDAAEEAWLELAAEAEERGLKV
jgi:hypothetical protein